MTDRLKKEDFVRLLATRMHTDEATATDWLDGVIETLYDSFKDGKGYRPGRHPIMDHRCQTR